MPQAPAQNIPINVVRRIRVQTRDNVTGQPSNEPLSFQGFDPARVIPTVDPADDRVVVLTPVAGGFTSVTVTKTPAGTDPLIIPCTVGSAVNIGGVVLVEVITPDQPKPV